MDELEYIDRFFNNELSPGEKHDFDRRIIEEPKFAVEVAFHLSARKLAQEQSAQEIKKRFKTIYKPQATVKKIAYWKTANPYVIAASVLFSIWFIRFVDNQKSQTQKLADTYIESNLKTLGVTMDGQTDSIQSALKLYNEQEYTKADSAFETMLRSSPENFTALKYAGIAELNAGEYEKALDHFNKLAAIQSLFANPGKFYQALTLMKRNGEGDRERTKDLLKEVVRNNLKGKETASEWLKQL